jgi:ribosomal protein L44E
MSQHHTKNTTAVSKHCPTCGRKTMHRVDFKREGTCMEHGATGLSRKQQQAQEQVKKAQDEADQQPGLF